MGEVNKPKKTIGLESGYLPEKFQYSGYFAE